MENSKPVSFRKTEDGIAYYCGWHSYRMFLSFAGRMRLEGRPDTFSAFYNSLKKVQRLAIGVEAIEPVNNETTKNKSIKENSLQS